MHFGQAILTYTCVNFLRKKAPGTTDECWKWHHAGENDIMRQTNRKPAWHTTAGILWYHRNIPAYLTGTRKQVLPECFAIFPSELCLSRVLYDRWCFIPRVLSFYSCSFEQTSWLTSKHSVKTLWHRYYWWKLEIMYNNMFGIKTCPSKNKIVLNHHLQDRHQISIVIHGKYMLLYWFS